MRLQICMENYGTKQIYCDDFHLPEARNVLFLRSLIEALIYNVIHVQVQVFVIITYEYAWVIVYIRTCPKCHGKFCQQPLKEIEKESDTRLDHIGWLLWETKWKRKWILSAFVSERKQKSSFALEVFFWQQSERYDLCQENNHVFQHFALHIG